MNDRDFRNDLQLAISGLETAVAGLADKEAALEKEYSQQLTKRNNSLVRHAEQFLPNLEQETLATLQSELPNFAAKAEVLALFSKAARLPVTLWTKLTGRTANYRTDALSNEFYMLRMKLAAHLSDARPVWLGNTADTDKLQKALDELRRSKAGAETQLDFLKRAHAAFAKDSSLAPSPKFRKAIKESADKMSAIQHNPQRYRYDSTQPNMTPPDHDDYNGLLLYMLTGIPTDSTTFALWALADHYVGGAEQNCFLGSGIGNDQTHAGEEAPTPTDNIDYPQDNSNGNNETSLGSLS